MGYKIGIDVGGTFTDLLLIDEQGNLEIFKTPTTPVDPATGTMNGLLEIATANGITLDVFLPKVDLIVHGTTITTNMVLTGTYAKTGFITVKGFRDYLNERRGMKRTLYTPKESPPKPIVPRYLIQGVEGRIDCDGKEFIPLNEDEVYQAIKVFKKEKVEAVAISLFFSFLNPSHELRIEEILKKEMPDTYVCVSHKVLPQVRIYERGSTTVFNACVAPGLRAYIASLTEKLKKNGFKGTLLLMQSNGGVMSPEVAMDFAVNTLLSGPAGGPKAGLYYSTVHSLKDIITTDMGGTSFDACLSRGGEPEITVENEVNEYRIAVPSLAIHSIGSGGGSIAWLDAGILKVGPQSAGAYPGPACYGVGGVEPTVTDADLILGYLNADYFLGGKMKLCPEKSEKAIREKVANLLGLNLHQAAFGIYHVVNINMAQGVKVASVSRGYDPRSCALIVAGGCGPIHACDIAEELEMQLLLVPKTASVLCAAGMLMSDLRHDFVRVYYSEIRPETVDLKAINLRLQEMKSEGFATLQKEGIPQHQMQFNYSADLRYLAQFNEIEIPLTLTDGQFGLNDLTKLRQTFDQKHDTLYGYTLPDNLELICLRAAAIGYTEKPTLKELPYLGEDASGAFKADRMIYYRDKFLTVPVYHGTKVGYGNNISGPAIIEEPTTTIFVTPNWQLTCDKYCSYLIYHKGVSLEEALDNIRK